MLSIALQMLIGDKGKYLGVVLGLAMATFLMTQQPAIFLGILSRSYGILSDAGLADIWVMDPKVQFIDDVKPLQDTQLARVRGVTGVGWAVPFFKGSARVRLENGNFQNSVLVGLDDASLVGGPAKMIRGTLADLRQSDGIIVNEEGARNRLARPASQSDQPPIPLTVGDTIELNDRRAVVVGICEATPSLQSQPVIYTTYSRAKLYAPQERKLLSFILVKIQDGADLKTVATSIHQATGLAAYSRVEFERKTLDFFLKNTGIAINFGISAAIGLLIGGAIAGQLFFNFTLDNLRYFAVFKAMGTSDRKLLLMILSQALVAGAIGYGLGIGLVSAFGWLTSGRTLAFKATGGLLALSAFCVILLCLVAAAFSLRRVLKLEPAVVFKA